MATSIEKATETSTPDDIDQTCITTTAKCNGGNAAATNIPTNISSEQIKNNAQVEALKDSTHLSEMESSLESNNFPIDEIPESIKVLDDIISEFEEASKPAVVTNAENQSEDDGYMSLSRKNMRKNDSEEASLSSLNRASADTSNQDFEIKANGELCRSSENVKHDLEKSSPDQNIIQTTLPKARNASMQSMIHSNYSSLPCCGARNSSFLGGDITGKHIRIGSCNGERNVLGIDISAVHKAVLRGGVAKLPEPIVNEHPVTIYPGPSDGSRSVTIGSRPQRLINSVEKHKEVYQKLKPLSSKSSSSSSSPRSTNDTLALKQLEIFDLSSNKVFNPKNRNCKSEQRLDDYNESDDDDGDDVDDDVDDDDDRDDFSEDSVDREEQSSLSMSAELKEMTMPNSRKHSSVAWEIHFNNERKRNQSSSSKVSNNKKQQMKKTSCSGSGSLNKTNEKTFGLAYSNAIYSMGPDDEFSHNVYAEDEEDFNSYDDDSLEYYANNSNMMVGKGTYVIRRNTNCKKPPNVVDVFELSAIKHAAVDIERHEPVVSRMCPLKQPLKHQNNCKADKPTSFLCSNSSIERKQMQRNSLPNSRDRLSLNIEPHSSKHSSLKKESDMKPMAAVSEGYSLFPTVMGYRGKKLAPTDLSYLLKQSKKQQIDRNYSIELKKMEHDNISNEYGNGLSFVVAYNCSSSNGPNNDFSPGKNIDIHSTSNSTTPHTDLAPTIEEDEEYSDLSYSGGGAVTAPSSTTTGHRSKLAEKSMQSALLRGDILSSPPPKRSLEFRPGVHKSESAKEMLLSQTAGFGPLPPSPPPPPLTTTTSSSKPNSFDYDALPLPPLPPSPSDALSSDEADDEMNCHGIRHSKPAFLLRTTSVEVHTSNHRNADDEIKRCVSRDRSFDRTDRNREKKRTVRHMSDDLPLPPSGISSYEHMPPAVPPHRGGHSANTMKSWSIDSNYRRSKSSKILGNSIGSYGGSGMTTPTGTHHPIHSNDLMGFSSSGVGGHTAKRYISYGTKRNTKQSPREEHRNSLQTSCSLPETPIFARGCDIPRTPFRRNNNDVPVPSGSRTAPRSTTTHNINMGTLGVNTCGVSGVSSMCRQRSISHALASNEMLRMSGVPARGWYPKQRSMRPASTENIDRLTSIRVWDCPATNIGGSGTSSRKPLTLPPNLTPSFLNKSPREALRRVTSLLITKKKNGKERKTKPYYEDTIDSVMPYEENTYKHKSNSNKETKHDTSCNNSTLPKEPKPPKKKSLFKNLWKKTKHFSLDQ